MNRPTLESRIENSAWWMAAAIMRGERVVLMSPTEHGKTAIIRRVKEIIEAMEGK